jgi:hypothetical protein
MDEGYENLVYPFPWDFKTSFTCRKILRHGPFGFTSHPKEGVLRIIIAPKNPSPWPGPNPQPLGPVASILTTTPPRRQFTGGLVVSVEDYTHTHTEVPGSIPGHSLGFF